MADKVLTLDADEMTTAQINKSIRKASDDGVREIVVANPRARHNLGVCILRPICVTFQGTVGYYCCSLCDGTTFHVHGNAGWSVGENNLSGDVVVDGDVGSSVGSCLHGGQIVVKGNAGARAGISMKGGRLIIAGNAGFSLGFMMQMGEIIVCGDVGNSVADSIYEGAVYVGGRIGELGSDAEVIETTDDELADIAGCLEERLIAVPRTFRKIVSQKKLYHFDEMELTERRIV